MFPYKLNLFLLGRVPSKTMYLFTTDFRTICFAINSKQLWKDLFRQTMGVHHRQEGGGRGRGAGFQFMSNLSKKGVIDLLL